MASALSEFLHSLPSGKELYQLFGAYGTVTSCRLPKKSDYSGHRGFSMGCFRERDVQCEEGSSRFWGESVVKDLGRFVTLVRDEDILGSSP